MATGKAQSNPLRILAVAVFWLGSDGYAYVQAFRRLGHEVRVVPSEHYIPADWTAKPLRALRRLCEPLMVREYTRALRETAQGWQPDVFFVFKGRYVAPEVVSALRAQGAIAINFYPDVSFLAHGKYLPRALPLYHWIFQTKSFGIEDLARQLGVRTSSFLPPSFDPEVHRPMRLTVAEQKEFEADVCFIGIHSPKKQKYLEALVNSLPQVRLRVWGRGWPASGTPLIPYIEGRPLLGLEYTKAIAASKISLGLLSETVRGASSGDLITARTFQIPGIGAFMLHERTPELTQHFREGHECAAFADSAELVEKVRYYLGNAAERQQIAAAGRNRALSAGYAVDYRAAHILEKVRKLSADPI